MSGNESHLFDTVRVGGVTLDNRVVVSPMCQFAAVDGLPSAWHSQHLGSLALSGAGLLVVESTAVTAQGRITPACLGLYSDEHLAAMTSLLADIAEFSAIPVAVQLAHAGRKASTQPPWLGTGGVVDEDRGGWQTLAPSAIPFDDERPTPLEASTDDLATLVSDYVAAARRAVAAGFAGVEVHAAHGYLLHQFLSPLTNRRADSYGGSQADRHRLPLEVFRAVREVIPESMALGVRVSGSDWHPGGLTQDDAVVFARELEAAGADYLAVSSGGITRDAKIVVGPHYQVPMAAAVKQAVSIPVMAVGMITDPHEADNLVASGTADLVALARAFLADPRWAWRAASVLGATVAIHPRYESAVPLLGRAVPAHSRDAVTASGRQ